MPSMGSRWFASGVICLVRPNGHGERVSFGGRVMGEFKRGWMLVSILMAILVRVSCAQVATTTVQDTVYRADGSAASGSVLISWSAFTTAAGSTVPAGTTSVTIGAGGLLTVALAPNAGANP